MQKDNGQVTGRPNLLGHEVLAGFCERCPPILTLAERMEDHHGCDSQRACPRRFHAGVVQITVNEYDIVISLRHRARGVAE